MARTVMVTGANRGIGLGFVEAALEHGDHVVATARNLNTARDLKKLKSQYPGKLDLFELDFDSPEIEKQLVKIMKQPEKIDLLVNNAGFYPNSITEKFDKLNLLQWESAFRINVVGPARVIRKALPRLEKSNRPVVLNITTQMASLADNTSGGSHGYRVTKVGLNMLTKGLAIDYPEVVFLMVHPGWVKTRMGGPNAEVPVQDSVAGILKLVEKASKKDSGRFFDYRGREISW